VSDLTRPSHFAKVFALIVLGGVTNLFGDHNANAWKEITSKAANGDPTYQFILGQMYAEGSQVPQNYNEAIKWTHRAAIRNNRNAQCYLGYLYLEKIGLIKRAASSRWYRETSESFQTIANLNQSSPREISEAARWFERAAVGGHTEAQCCIGKFYALGIGVRRNDLNAMNYYRRAAKQGHRDAQFLLAEMLISGFLRNYTEAFQLFKDSAEQGDCEAAYYLAQLYDCGYGTTPNAQTAMQWYQRASAGGSARASLWLAWSYYHGRGVKKDMSKSAQLFLQAARKGSGEAQKQTGLMYYHGLGVKKSLSDSYSWYHIASCQGLTDCGKTRDAIGKLMTPQEHETAKRFILNHLTATNDHP
jgi:uncharacterized protein